MLSTTNSNTWGKKSLQTLFFFILIAQLCFPQLNQQTAKTNLRKTNDLSKQQYRLHPNFNSDVEGRLSNKYLSSNTLNQLHSGIEKRISPQSQIYVIDTAYILQVDDGNLPADTIRYLFSFNASAKRTLELQQRLIDGTWVDSYRRTNTYDAQGNMLTNLTELWENSQWVNGWRYTYTYNAQGNLASIWFHAGLNSSWVPANLNTFSGYEVYDMAGNEYRFWGHNVNFIYKLIVTEVLSEKTNVPEYFTLQQNFPNPFNPRTTINYAIPKESFVMIKVYDMLGREIKTLVNEEKTAGNYSVSFNAENLSSGIYFYTIKADAFVQTKKMVLLK